MTTVSLIFLAIYWNLEHKNIVADAPLLADKIFKTFLVNEFEVNKKKIRLKLNKEDRTAFDHLVDFGEGGSYTGSNIVTNFSFFYERVKNLNIKIDDFYLALWKLFVIDIFLGPDDDPQLIFESLNSTGLDLTEADKIRNYVLMGLEEDKQEEYYTKYWSFIERDCSGKNELDNFIRDEMTSKVLREQDVPTYGSQTQETAKKCLAVSIKQDPFEAIMSGEKDFEEREVRPTTYRQLVYFVRDGVTYQRFEDIPDFETDIMMKPIKYDQLKIITGQMVGKRPYAVVNVEGAHVEFVADGDKQVFVPTADGRQFPLAIVVYDLGEITERADY